MRRRGVLAATLVALVVALAGCSGLPTSGPVNAGLSAGDVPSVPDLSFRPNSPQPGATPSEIVTGFLLAATSPEDQWEIAKEFLTDGYRDQWQPTAGVTIYQPGSRALTESEDGSSVTLALTIEADVDATGAYGVSTPVATTLPPYQLVQQDGEWRIAGAPEGVVIESDFFERVYRPYSIMYYDPTWTFLVPDVRWFPYRSSSVAAWISRALVDGAPSPWLEQSVESAFPEEVAYSGISIADAEGEVQVELTEAALRTQDETRARMQRQLGASLRSAGVPDVDMVVSGSVLEVEPAPVASTAIEPLPLVSSDGQVGFLSSDGVMSIAGGLGDVLAPLDPTSIALGRGEEVAAARLPDGSIVRVSDDGDQQVVDTRARAIEPSIDPAGYVWSVPAGAPSAVTATGADGVVHEISGAWPQASRIASMQVSRDGTRLAAVVSEAGGDWLVVAGIVRDGSGVVPESLGIEQRVALLDGLGQDVAWLDDETVGALVRGDELTRLLTQTIGGVGAFSSTPTAQIDAVQAGTASNVPRILDGDGALYVRRGASWTQTASGVQVLGSQLGAG